jgi:hypothetical protein
LVAWENRKNGWYFVALSPENALKSSTAFTGVRPEDGVDAAGIANRISKAAIVAVADE